jgi:hypothetical protein
MMHKEDFLPWEQEATPTKNSANSVKEFLPVHSPYQTTWSEGDLIFEKKTLKIGTKRAQGILWGQPKGRREM